jgi:hypothetical protein
MGEIVVRKNTVGGLFEVFPGNPGGEHRKFSKNIQKFH